MCNNSSFVEREIFVEFVVFIAVQYVDEDHARLRRTVLLEAVSTHS